MRRLRLPKEQREQLDEWRGWAYCDGVNYSCMDEMNWLPVTGLH